VYFLEQKLEAFIYFKQFKALTEKQCEHSLKILRTDRGREFTNNEFLDYCKQHGIKRELTARYTPQQNGVAERKNRTIMEMALSMLQSKNLPKQFWDEAVNTAIYILNRPPTKTVFKKTPYETWNKRKPIVKHFKIFRCIAYAHIPKQTCTKLEERGEKCIFIGYSDASKAYTLYNPETKKLIILRDMIFDEMTEWKWSKDSSPVPAINEESHEPSTYLGSDTPPPNPRPRQEDIPESSSAPTLHRSQREQRPPARFEDYQSNITAYALFAGEPTKYEEATKEEAWVKAMDEEIQMIEKNQTWELTNKPPEKEIIGLKWVYKIKYNDDGNIQKYKARLVAKGYSQQPGVDFNETFAPVVHMETIWTVLALAAQPKLPVYQLNVKSAFLNGDLQEEIYVEQPKGYVIKGQEDKVYRLGKALYRLKQAPRAWNSNIDGYLQDHGFLKSSNEPSLYIKNQGAHNFLILCLYVDDLMYTSTSEEMINEVKEAMIREYEMTDLGLMKYFLGIQIKQEPGRIFISQEKYIDDLLKKFQMKDCKPMPTPMITSEKMSKNDEVEKVNETNYQSLVGSLIYLTHTRSDIIHTVGMVSRFMSEPNKNHYAAAKRILRYIKGTKYHGILYKSEEQNGLRGYTYSD